MKLIITGATGFIGTNLILSLLNEKKISKIIFIDNFKTSSKKNLNKIKYFDSRNITKFYKLSINENNLVNKLKLNNNFDILIHLAAQSSGENSFHEPIYDIDTNICGTINVIDLAKKLNVKKIIYTSTMSVYGNVKVKRRIKENYQTKPTSIYGVSKLTSERIVKSLCYERKIKFTILRLFNVYGSYQDLSNMKQGMLSIYLSYLINRRELLVKGSLERYRDFIYIDDLTNAFKKLIYKKSHNKTYNIGSGNKTSVKKLIKLLIKYLNLKPKEVKIKIGKNTPGDVIGFISNSDSFKKDYKWEPKTNIEEGIFKTINFYKNEKKSNL